LAKGLALGTELIVNGCHLTLFIVSETGHAPFGEGWEALLYMGFLVEITAQGLRVCPFNSHD